MTALFTAFHRLWTVLFCVCAVFAVTASLRADDLPLPPEYQLFQKAMDTVNSASMLTVDDKAKLRQQHDNIQAQFQQVWASLNAAYTDCKSKLTDNAARVEAHNQRGDGLKQEAAAVDQTDAGAVAAYNEQADAYNTEKAQLEQEQKEILATWNQQVDKTQEWIDSSGMKAFVDAVRAKLIFYYGPAYNQLVHIHDGTLDWDGRNLQ